MRGHPGSVHLSSPWIELILFAGLAVILAVTALADLASCLPSRRSLREFLAELSESANGNGERALDELRTARPAVRLVQGVAFLALVLLAVRLGQLWWPAHPLAFAAIVAVVALVVLASALPLAVLARRPLPSSRARTLAVTLGRFGAPLRAASDLVERIVALVIPAAPVAAVPESAAPVTHEEAVEEAEELIERALRLDRLTARDIMVPRTDIVAVPFEASVREAIAIARESKHSRLPVYQGTIDRIVGIVHVRDLLRFALEPAEGIKVGDVMREAYFIPESKRADELLRDLQRQRVHMAVVVDEFGGTAGIVTIEDVLEEIVGEIQDEFDEEEARIEELGGGLYAVDGRIPIVEVNEFFELDLPHEDFETIGGYVLGTLGRPPRPGDVVEADGATLQVKSVDGPRVSMLTLRRKERSPSSPPP